MSTPADTTGQPGPLGFALMAGSSIAGRDAAPWVTDFLTAAYHRRPAEDRDVDDLRLAFCIVTTYWYRTKPQRRLRITDLPAFHKAFGGERFSTDGSGRGHLDREALLRGAASLLGDWFPEAYADDGRRAWGIAFPSSAELGAYDHSHRLKHQGRAWVRAAGTWDPMPWHVDKAYKAAGQEAQHAFWGQGGDESMSLLHQLAKRIAG